MLIELYGLDILDHCYALEDGLRPAISSRGYKYGETLNMRLSSWVPDWRVPPLRQPLISQDYKAAGITKGTKLEHQLVDTDPKPELGRSFKTMGLQVHGFVFDSVKSVSRLPGMGDRDFALVSWLDSMPELGTTYLTGESKRDAIFRTIFANVDSVVKDIFLNGEVSDLIPPEHQIPDVAINSRYHVRVEAKSGQPAMSGLDFASYRHDFFKLMGKTTQGRTLCLSSKNYIGLVPQETREDDLICILYGSDLPIILRSVGTDFIVVGGAYVHGIMNGEATQPDIKKECTDREFVLI